MKQATVTQIEKIWLSNKEAQAYLGVGMDFFKNLRSSGRISFFKVGTTVFYRKRDIDRLIEKQIEYVRVNSIFIIMVLKTFVSAIL